MIRIRPPRRRMRTAPVRRRRRLRDRYRSAAGIVSVRSIHRDTDGEIASAPVEIPVPARDVTVRYAFRRRTRWRPWRRSRLVLAADQAVRIPPLVVVHSAGRVMPLRAEQGTPIVRLPGADLPQAASWSVRIPAPPRRGPDWLTCFFDGDPPARHRARPRRAAGAEHARLSLLLQPVRRKRHRLPLHRSPGPGRRDLRRRAGREPGPVARQLCPVAPCLHR